MAALDSRVLALEQKIVTAEAAEKDLADRAARMKELDRQTTALEGKVQANLKRAKDLAALVQEGDAAVLSVAGQRSALEAYTTWRGDRGCRERAEAHQSADRSPPTCRTR